MPAAGIRARSARLSVADPARLIRHPSPNFGPRRDGAQPDMIVLHYTGMDSADSALERLCDPEAEVSAHYLICENGRIRQLVEEDMRAWHAGAGKWGDVSDVNSRSIGIELVNTGAHPFPEPQMATLGHLMRGIMARLHIRPERVIAHSDLAPMRKSDPGRRFDWRRLALEGLSIWPHPGAPAGDFLDAARRFGYPLAEGDTDDSAPILSAFRQRFRPWASGALDDTDRALMTDLAARFPVDRARHGA
ncbi:MAG: N-acetylmuramoyl-L-alanine amidase [Pseudomonadota bacterium]|uniref:N-acetylmuramoyl-L-alanine amidase n=1 Tax=Roseovarius salincola TaxID=2978479 RepID=UPI003F24639E